MSATLARRQALLLEAVGAARADAGLAVVMPQLDESVASGRLLRGLQAYRSQAQELCARVLAAAFPVVARLVGETGFSALSRGLWRAHPPRRGDLGVWGADFADWLAAQEAVSAELPWLGDVARFEWALHQAATAADVAEDPASLGLLATGDPDTIRLRLGAGLAWLDSAWPVLSIVQAHACEPPDLAVARARLDAGQGESALVWRQGWRPCSREFLPGETVFVRALAAGHCLGPALAASPELNFAAWLHQAVSERLLVGAESESP